MDEIIKVNIDNSASFLNARGLSERLYSSINNIYVIDVIIFIVPITQFVEFEVIGRLFLPDVILVCIFPIMLLFHHRRIQDRLSIIFLLLAGLWLAGQVASDLYRDTVFQDYIRGWAKIVLTVINFCSLYLLFSGKKYRLILYALGLAVGGLIKYYVNPTVFAISLPWKFGYGESITWLFIIISALMIKFRIHGAYIASIIITGASVINLILGYRSLGGICFVLALYILYYAAFGDNVSVIYLRRRRIFFNLILIIITIICTYTLYDLSARYGLLGERATEIYEHQSTGKYGLLLGGRSEFLVSSRAIKDSPFIGHGSWAKNYDYAFLLSELREAAGYHAISENEDELIPTHSHLFGAWVEAGILGAIFWLWVLGMAVRILFIPHNNRDYLTVLLPFIALLLIWDVLFSPFGAERRFITPYYIIAIIYYIKSHEIGRIVT